MHVHMHIHMHPYPSQRAAGYSGEVLCDAINGPVFNCMDDTFTRPDGSQQPAIVAFMNGEIGWQWNLRSREDRQRAIVKQVHLRDHRRSTVVQRSRTLDCFWLACFVRAPNAPLFVRLCLSWRRGMGRPR